MSKFLFHGLYSPTEGENERVVVLVTDLNYFLHTNGTVFASAVRSGEHVPLGEVRRDLITFDYCEPDR